jgi:hypothetical protein
MKIFQVRNFHDAEFENLFPGWDSHNAKREKFFPGWGGHNAEHWNLFPGWGGHNAVRLSPFNRNCLSPKVNMGFGRGNENTVEIRLDLKYNTH